MPQTTTEKVLRIRLIETVHYRVETNEVRCWRNGWSSDTFEIITHQEWATVAPILTKLGFQLQEHGDED